MKLIDEKVIEEALNKAYEKSKENAYFGSGFYHGVSFAQQQLQPFIVEFAEWIDMYYQRSLNGKWRGIDVPVCDTTEQLLEEFIESKNKK